MIGASALALNSVAQPFEDLKWVLGERLGSKERTSPLEIAEQELRDLVRKHKATHEIGYLYEGYDVQILKIDGGKDMFVHKTYEARNKVCTHLHLPFVDGKRAFLALTSEDIISAWKMNLMEARAVSVDPETGRNTLSSLKRGDRIYWPEADFVHFQDNFLKELRATFTLLRKTKRGSYYSIADLALNNVLYKWSGATGCIYSWETWK